MDEKQNKEMNPKLREGLGFLALAIVFLASAIWFYPYIAKIFQILFYVIAIILFGAVYNPMMDYLAYLKNKKLSKQLSQINSQPTIRPFIWIIKKLLGPAILIFMTFRYYYEIYDIGIENFDAPVMGMFIALFLPILCIIYYLKFIRK